MFPRNPVMMMPSASHKEAGEIAAYPQPNNSLFSEDECMRVLAHFST